MKYRRIVSGLTIAVLSVIVVGCAGPAAETGAGLAGATASSSSSSATTRNASRTVDGIESADHDGTVTKKKARLRSR